jgi:hypothetical protein
MAAGGGGDGGLSGPPRPTRPPPPIPSSAHMHVTDMPPECENEEESLGWGLPDERGSRGTLRGRRQEQGWLIDEPPLAVMMMEEQERERECRERLEREAEEERMREERAALEEELLEMERQEMERDKAMMLRELQLLQQEQEEREWEDQQRENRLVREREDASAGVGAGAGNSGDVRKGGGADVRTSASWRWGTGLQTAQAQEAGWLRRLGWLTKEAVWLKQKGSLDSLAPGARGSAGKALSGHVVGDANGLGCRHTGSEESAQGLVTAPSHTLGLITSVQGLGTTLATFCPKNMGHWPNTLLKAFCPHSAQRRCMYSSF